MQSTPCKNTREEIASPYKTPNSKNGIKPITQHSGGFSFLTNHKTPPSGLTKFIARNPFDADLTSRLHLSVISPTIFNKAPPKSSEASPFAWTIEELSIMTPAVIDECPHQQYDASDPEVERHAQKAIDKFFSEAQILPSPWHIKKEPQVPLLLLTPTRSLEFLNTSKESETRTRDCATQTVLTLPPELPKELEEALKPYFTYTQDQNVETDDANSSSNSLRRKLFFNHDESSDEEKNISFVLSPLKRSTSPPQSGMFVHGTPVGNGTFSMQRYHGTPYVSSRNMSPPNMSPISNTAHEMSCESISSRPRSATRLNFTTFMSLDVSSSEEKEKKQCEKDPQKTPTLIDDEPQPLETKNEAVEMLSMLQDVTSVENPESSLVTEKDKMKINFNWCKSISVSNTSQKNCTTFVRSHYSEQNSVFNQDTGYHTYSMNNTSDNRSLTPIKQQFNCSEKNSISKTSGQEEDVKSSNWQVNIKNMFSSTPSKHTQPKNIL